VDGPPQLAVIGIGALALRGFLPHLTEHNVAGRVRVRALCDPVDERAEAAAARYEVPGVFADVETKLAEAGIDAASVASPIGLHFQHCCASLEAGKHVHVNRTMTTTVREVDELIALAEERNPRIVASPGEVLQPQVTQTRELIRSSIDPSWYFRRPGGGPMRR
jgi:predicted dehydrogenase